MKTLQTLPTAEEMLAEAQAATGLSDWGDEDFLAPFRVLMKSLHAEARLNAVGVVRAHRRLQDLLRGRLRMAEDRKRFPAIADEVIKAPLVMIGLSRTGSTFLHDLLGHDPRNRVPRSWEVWFPSPPPETASYRTDPRIAHCDEVLGREDFLTPEMLRAHPYGAERTEESNQIWQYSFVTPDFMAYWNVPSHIEHVYSKCNFEAAFRFERRMLQHLQYRCPGRWVMKGQPLLAELARVFSFYPDARIIMTHRDPAKVMASLTSMLAEHRRPFSDHIPAGEFGMTALQAHGVNMAMKFREQPQYRDRFHDVHFLDLMAEPMAAVRGIYERFGIPLTPEAESAMTAWMEQSQAEHRRGGRPKVSLADAGLDYAEIDRHFGDYIAKYRITLER